LFASTTYPAIWEAWLTYKAFIVQLLTLGGCGIWALIDMIRIITGDLQPKDGEYEKTL